MKLLEIIFVLYLIKSITCPLLQDYDNISRFVLYAVTIGSLLYSYYTESTTKDDFKNLLIVHYIFYLIIYLLVAYILLTVRFNKTLSDVSVVDLWKLPFMPLVFMAKC
jgi:hypothetical protein